MTENLLKNPASYQGIALAIPQPVQNRSRAYSSGGASGRREALSSMLRSCGEKFLRN